MTNGAFAPTVPTWMTQITTFPGPCIAMKGSPLGDGCTLAEQVYGDTSTDGFAAFAYCWRRFGPPRWGSDPHKDLARYILGTPHPGIFLSLTLSALPLPYAVGYVVTHTLRDTWEAPRHVWEDAFQQWWADTVSTTSQAYSGWEARMDHTVLQEAEGVLGPLPPHVVPEGPVMVAEALTAALVELLRPVFIRDVALNMLGRVADADLDERDSAPVSPYAGFGIPQTALPTRMEVVYQQRNSL